MGVPEDTSAHVEQWIRLPSTCEYFGAFRRANGSGGKKYNNNNSIIMVGVWWI